MNSTTIIQTSVAAVVHFIIFIIIHLIFMAINEGFAMGHTGFFLAAFITGGLSFLMFRKAAFSGKLSY